jgi:hypothetical protein
MGCTFFLRLPRNQGAKYINPLAAASRGGGGGGQGKVSSRILLDAPGGEIVGRAALL